MYLDIHLHHLCCVPTPLAGYGGDYCQGRLQSIQLASSGSFDSGSVSLSPGRWTYYYVTINTAGLTVASNTLTFSWSVSQPVLSNLYFIFSPVYSNSLGQLYFMPAATWVLNSSGVIPVRSECIRIYLAMSWESMFH